MFPLQTDSLPLDAASLREALEQSLNQLLHSPQAPMVEVEDQNYPQLRGIRLSLDGAAVRDDLPPRPSAPKGLAAPALRAEQLEIRGRPVRVRGAAINLECRVREVEIGQARDAEGRLLLLIQKATQGHVDVSIPLSDLETLVRAATAAAAKKQGVIVEEVRLELRNRTERSLEAEVKVRARKLFLTAAIRIKGSLAIDEKLTARLSGLDCAGEGTLATLACGFLLPHLQRLNGREFSLLALPMGEVKLREVRIATGNDLRVTAEFGQTAA